MTIEQGVHPAKDELELKQVAVADAVTHELKTERALNITFQNLNYSVKVPAPNPGKKKPFGKKIMVDKTIIRGVSGVTCQAKPV